MKIIHSRKLTNLKWLNMFNVEYTDRTGKNKVWQVASRKKEPKCVTGNFSKPDAVVIVPYHTAEEKIVLTKEYRVPLADYEYGFPAGLVDAGETIQEAARRELAEETGLVLTRLIKTGPPIYSSAGMTDESVSMVYVECEGEPSTAGNERSEDIEVIFVSAAEASRLCDEDLLKFDAKAWLVLSNFAESGYICGIPADQY
jgi:ADP-ribose pyrophosphatase